MTISLNNVTKKIKGATVLNEVSLTFESGVIYGLKGKNGCGKTMLMRAIAGLIHPTKGSICLNEKKLHDEISVLPSVGVLIENPAFLPDYTGVKNLTLLAGLKAVAGAEQIDNALRRVGLDPTDKRVYRKYSLGMKQRLGIACALMEKPDIILLDEPVNAIDEKGVPQIWQAIREEKERGALIIVSCHDTEELMSLADVIIEMEEGRICGQRKTLNPKDA